jgi:hypothetical protein
LIQFNAFIPYIVAECEDTFANTIDLSGDSFGALVSLVYSRGSEDYPGNPRRAEMYNIQVLMRAKDYFSVPAQIRQMKHLWADKPDLRGLVVRRELEALLFEAGLGE